MRAPRGARACDLPSRPKPEQGGGVLDGGSRFEVRCLHCPMRLVADRIRDADATAIADHLRARHRELRVGERRQLGEVLDHFRVRPNRE